MFVEVNNIYKLQEALVNDDMIVEKLTLMEADFILHPYIINEEMLETFLLVKRLHHLQQQVSLLTNYNTNYKFEQQISIGLLSLRHG